MMPRGGTVPSSLRMGRPVRRCLPDTLNGLAEAGGVNFQFLVADPAAEPPRPSGVGGMGSSSTGRRRRRRPIVLLLAVVDGIGSRRRNHCHAGSTFVAYVFAHDTLLFLTDFKFLRGDREQWQRRRRRQRRSLLQKCLARVVAVRRLLGFKYGASLFDTVQRPSLYLVGTHQCAI
jgi:hypothetical protein